MNLLKMNSAMDSEAYSMDSKTSKMKLFTKIVNDFLS